MKKTFSAATSLFVVVSLATLEAHTGHEFPDTSKLQKSSWAEIDQETLAPGLKRQYLHGDKSMLVRFEFEKGSKVPMHSHPNEQITYVEKGHMLFSVGEKKVALKTGDLLVIPPNVSHGGDVIEHTIEYDVFAPPRYDWIMKQDAYLRGELPPEVESPYNTASKLPESEIEVVAKLDFRPGNLAVLPDGRIVLSVHPLGNKPSKFKVLELLPGGSTKPFPNEKYGAAVDLETGIGFDDVIGIESDRYGFVYMLDKGGVDGRPAKLVVWDTIAGKLKHSIAIPVPVMQANSFIQDLAIDLTNGKVYLADMTRSNLIDRSAPAIITVDLATGQSRRALFGHPSLDPENVPFVIDGQELAIKDGEGKIHAIDLGLNPITIDPADEWVYFGAMNSKKLYRIPAATLADESLAADQVRSKVELYGEKTVGDGIVAGSDGKIYTTAVNKNAIHYTDDKGKDHELVKSSQLSWPDGLSIGPDNMIYATVNQLGRIAPLNKNVDRTKEGEFYLVRTKPAGLITIGR